MIVNNEKYDAKYPHKSVIKPRGMFFATQRSCFQNNTRTIVFFLCLFCSRVFKLLHFCEKKNMYGIFCLMQNFTFYLTVFIVAFKMCMESNTKQ